MKKRTIALVVSLLLVAGTARAEGIGGELAAKAGKTIDLRADPALAARLLARGLVAKDATSVVVDRALLERAFASDRFFNHVNALRYHVGDRILVEDPGSGGRYSNRARIMAVNADGTYQVKVWDKPEPLTHPDTGKVDPFTGQPKAGAPETRVRVTENGVTEEKSLRVPWLVHSNARIVTLTHAQIDALNGIVRHDALLVPSRGGPAGVYSVGRWAIDPANDPMLADAIARAKVLADGILPSSKLELPLDRAQRAAKLEEIARLQEKLITAVYNDNFMANPLRNENAKARLDALPQRRPDLVGKIGGVLESRAGICIEQAAALQAILESLGDRGFTSRAMSGPTIENNFGHGFLIARLADGKPYMLDPAWHGMGDKHAIDNLDYATFDGRNNSNRRINASNQATTHPTAFVDPASTTGIDLSRGYDTGSASAYLALLVREHARANGGNVEDVARQVVALRQLEGDFSARAVAERARALTFDPASPGMLGGLKGIGDPLARNADDAR